MATGQVIDDGRRDRVTRHTTFWTSVLLEAVYRVAIAIEKLNSRTLLGHFPRLFKQWRS